MQKKQTLANCNKKILGADEVFGYDEKSNCGSTIPPKRLIWLHITFNPITQTSKEKLLEQGERDLRDCATTFSIL